MAVEKVQGHMKPRTVSLFYLLEDAIIKELEEDENAAIPTLMVLEKELYQKLVSTLVIKSTNQKLPETQKQFKVLIADRSIVIRSADWEYNTVH